MPKIIVSYRRSDSQAIAGRIFDRLSTQYGDDSVFMDIDNIPFGIDFRDHIKTALAQSDIVVAVIGPRWAGATPDGQQRIDEESDPVRVEVESALRSGVPVLPVLVDGATMPGEKQLPEGLKPLAFINAAPVDIGRDFRQHMDRLTRSIDGIVVVREEARRGAAAPVVAAPVTEPPASPAPRARSARTTPIVLAAAAVVLALAAVAWYVVPGYFGVPKSPATSPQTSSTGFDVQFPERTGRVVDDAVFLAPPDRDALIEKLAALEAKTTDQVVVVTVKSTGSLSPERYATRLAEEWNLGQQGKQNGAVLLFANNPGKTTPDVVFAVRTGLISKLSRGVSDSIIETLLSPLRADDVPFAIKVAVDRVISVLAPAQPPPGPAYKGSITDELGILHPDTITALTAKLTDLETKKGLQVVIALLRDAPSGSISEFGEALSRRWKVGGDKQSGALLVLFPSQHKLTLYIGPGAPTSLDRVVANLIVQQADKRLQSNDPAGAVTNAIDDFVEVLTGDAKAWQDRVTGTQAAPTPVAPQAPPPMTYRVLPNVSGGIQNMRSGPATKYPIVVAVPAGATGITIGACRKAEDATRPWCAANWRSYSGWISSCCIVDEKTGAPPKVD